MRSPIRPGDLVRAKEGCFGLCGIVQAVHRKHGATWLVIADSWVPACKYWLYDPLEEK